MLPDGITLRSRLTLLGSCWLALDPWLRTAIVVWTVMTIATCTRSAIMLHNQSVYPIWKGAGHNWLASQDLYQDVGNSPRDGYRYSPLCAALFTVCELVPERLGNVVWRLINAGALLAALCWWLHAGVPVSISLHDVLPAVPRSARDSIPRRAAHDAGQITQQQRGIFYLLVAPLALGSLNNGQANLVLAALMLVAVTAVAVNRWNLAALCLAFAVMLKLYPLALALLLFLLYPRRLALRFLLAMGGLLVLPFLLQQPDYVLRQYHLWWERIGHGDTERRFSPLHNSYRDVWMLIRVWRLPITVRQYTFLQLGGAGVCAALAGLSGWRAWPDRQRTLTVFTLAVLWMMLLGPSPESCTFVLIAPALAWWLLQTRMEHHWVSHYLTLQGWALLAGCVLAGTSPIGIALYHTAGLQPLGVLLFAAGFGVVLIPRFCVRTQAQIPLIDSRAVGKSQAA